MKLSSILLILGLSFTGVSTAGDILTTNSELYKKANEGDIKSMEILSRFYINQYSFRYNPEHSRYWRCRIEEIEPTKESDLNCGSLLTSGKKKKYDVFYQRGEKIREIKLSTDVMQNLDLEVPPEREWHIKWSKSNCEGICSYEIAIEGYFHIGKQKKYLIGRDSNISISGDEDGEIWVSSGSKITIQLESKLVEITEHAL